MALLGIGSVAQAAPSCRLPESIPGVPAEVAPVDQIVRRPITRYTFALSWSPEWCRTRSGKSSERLQCRDNSFGWVLHGLWPDGEGEPHPRYCHASTALRERTVRRNLCTTPSAALLQHEWAAHGTCGWRDPDAYFRRATKLWNGLKRPDPAQLAAINPDLTAGDLRAAFVTANPRLAAGAINIGVDAEGRLKEVQLCYGLSFKPMACPMIGAKDSQRLRVEPIRVN